MSKNKSKKVVPLPIAGEEEPDNPFADFEGLIDGEYYYPVYRKNEDGRMAYISDVNMPLTMSELKKTLGPGTFIIFAKESQGNKIKKRVTIYIDGDPVQENKNSNYVDLEMQFLQKMKVYKDIFSSGDSSNVVQTKMMEGVATMIGNMSAISSQMMIQQMQLLKDMKDDQGESGDSGGFIDVIKSAIDMFVKKKNGSGMLKTENLPDQSAQPLNVPGATAPKNKVKK